MTINQNLFNAILSMDSYNRGYDGGIALSESTSQQIGSVTIYDSLGDASAEDIGFYAVAYQYNSGEPNAGDIVISYRGTDDLSLSGGDTIHGWPLGVGDVESEQGLMAIQFYKDVAVALDGSGVDYQTVDISLTGHSLGGGLSGYVGSLYGQDALIYDSMAFSAAAANAQVLSASNIDPDLRALIYDTDTPWVVDDSGIEAHRIEGESLDNDFVGVPATAYSLGANVSLSGKEKHDITTLIIHGFADSSFLGEASEITQTDWQYAASYHWDVLFDNDFAEDLGVGSFTGELATEEKYSTILRQMIAYSAIDEGSLVYGDTAIRALYDDANDLGAVLKLSNTNSVVDDAAYSLSSVYVQFAGELAFFEETNNAFHDGALTYVDNAGGHKLEVDFTSSLWSSIDSNYHSGLLSDTREELVDQSLDNLNYLDALNVLGQITGNYTTSVYEKVSLAAENNGGSFSVSGSLESSNDFTLFVGSDGDDVITNTFGNIVISSGDGNDTIHGSSGKDVVFGGDGVDQIFGNGGDDYLYGGLDSDLLRGGGGHNHYFTEGSDHIYIDIAGTGVVYSDTSAFSRNTIHMLDLTISDLSNLEFVASSNDLKIQSYGSDILLIKDQFTSVGNSSLLKVWDANDDVIFSYDLRYLDASAIGGGRSFADMLAPAGSADDDAMEEASDFLDQNLPPLPPLPDVDVPAEDFAEELANHAFWTDKYADDVLLRGVDGTVGIDQAKVDLAQSIANIGDVQQFWEDEFFSRDFGAEDGRYSPEDWFGNVLGEFKASILAEVVPIDPLVLDLDGDGIELLSVENGVYWDLDTDGFAEAAGWVAPDDGLLALDANSDGVISTQTELFGSETQDGFSALSVLDSNSDNVIDASDAQFGDLLVWQDVNSDGISQSGEMFSLSSLGITAISLNDSNVNYTIEGHRISHESTFTINGQAQVIGEAWFLLDQANTRYDQSYDLDIRVLFLPSARGYGNLPDLHIAMSLDSALLTQVEDIATKSLDELLDPSFDLQSTMYDMLYTWAGVDGVSPTSRGPNIDARIVEFLEEMSDDEFYSEAYGLADKTEPNADAAEILESAFFDFYREMMIKLLLQTPAGEEIFSTTGDYNPFTGDWTGSYTLDFTAIETLFDNMALTGQGLEDAWGSVFHVINKVIGVGNLSSTDYSTLSTLVADSDPASLLDIDDVLLNTRNIFIGSSLDETFNGTEGNDFVWANGGADTFYGEGGNDFFTGGSAGSLVYGDAGNDTISSQGTIYGGEGDDIIDIRNGVGYGEDGDDLLSGDGTMYGGEGDDYILAEDDSIVYGGLGDDQIEIGANSNTEIHWTPGDGNDAIMTSVYDNDATLYIHGGMTAADLRFYSTEGYDPFLDEMTDALAIEIDETEVITISNQLIDDRRDIETIIFDDSSTLDLTAGLVMTGTSSNDNLFGTKGNDTIYGLDGNDYIDGWSGDSTLYGGDGNDNLRRGIEIWGGNGNDQIDVRNGGVGYGEEGDDILTGVNATLYGGAGNDIFQVDNYDDAEIYGGTGDDEIIIGVSSSQNIYWSAGDGNDSIGTTAYDNDAVLYMQGGIKAHDLTYTQTNGYDYRTGGNSSDTLAITYGSETIKVSNQFYDSRRDLETIVFDDNTELHLDRTSFSLYGTSGADTLTGVTYVGSEDDEIYGYDGNDTLNGLAGDDALHAGSGNDTLTGGDGADTYYYTSGDDVINESSSSGTTFDRLVMASGIVEADLSYAQSGDDLVITVSGLGSITLTSFYDAAQDYQVEELEVDSTLIDLTALSFDETITGTSGDDTITGTTGDDVIDAGEGNDTVDGGAGNDTISYASATSGVTVDLAAGTATGQGSDTLSNIENIIGSDYDDDIEGDNYTNNVFVAGSGRDDVRGYNGDDIFYDITNYLNATIDTSIEDGDYSNNTFDRFYGGGGNDTFYVQAGATYINGGTGDDVFHLWFHEDGTAGSEIYILDSFDSNKIYFENLDYDNTDYYFTFADNNPFQTNLGSLGALTLHYTGTSTDTQVLIDDAYGSGSVDYIFEWADGTIKNLTDLDFVIEGTTGDDTITGTTNADYIMGYGGNNDIDGGAGNDFIGSDTGNDTIDGGDGDDAIFSWGGDDIIYGGNGNDRIELTGTGNTVVYAGAGDDYINAKSGGDTIYGGDGNDEINLGNDNDTAYGEAGDDDINGGFQDDYMSGGTGNDYLVGSRGHDTYVYTSGLDVFNEVGTNNGSDIDTVHIAGTTTINDLSIVDFQSNNTKIIIDSGVDEIQLSAQRSSNAKYHFEKLSFDDGFETDQLDDYGNWITGTSGYDFTSGTTGNDVVIGKGGDDSLGGANGDDDIHGGSGADTITGGDGADYLHGGVGNDDISGNDGLDILYGGDGADTFNFDADAFNNIDEVRDFDTSESDVIDIAQILDGYYDSSTDTLSDFVQFVDDGSDSLLQIDQNGGGDSFATVARLTDLTGLSADTLETNGYLVTEI